MDITIHQISNGTKSELLLLRDSLVSYLKQRKFGHKIIHLLKILKSINAQLDILKSLVFKGHYSKDHDIVSSNKGMLLTKVPTLFMKNTQLLGKKRELEISHTKKLADEEENLFKFHFNLDKKDLFIEDEEENYYSLRFSTKNCSSTNLSLISDIRDEITSNSNYIDDMFNCSIFNN